MYEYFTVLIMGLLCKLIIFMDFLDVILVITFLTTFRTQCFSAHVHLAQNIFSYDSQ